MGEMLAVMGTYTPGSDGHPHFWWPSAPASSVATGTGTHSSERDASCGVPALPCLGRPVETACSMVGCFFGKRIPRLSGPIRSSTRCLPIWLPNIPISTGCFRHPAWTCVLRHPAWTCARRYRVMSGGQCHRAFRFVRSRSWRPPLGPRGPEHRFRWRPQASASGRAGLGFEQLLFKLPHPTRSVRLRCCSTVSMPRMETNHRCWCCLVYQKNHGGDESVEWSGRVDVSATC